ncbi:MULTISPECIES: nuclear transport factor 2 family protein [unclassified Nocardiopsis]|uniref:nuclear transport factor 2 family protein n=1 Tax=unclassified Nocardiopsis TaxID=2649073 RepID=UPI00135CC5EF|nr:MULTISPECIES: nuclear transport factor 2 family protein [unclassified Nocardiopsis]
MFSQTGGAYLTPSEAVATIGAEHVRLSYHYLDRADMDGYASLLDPETRFRYPGQPVSRGPAQVSALMERSSYTLGRHSIFKMVSGGDTVAAIGRFTCEGEQPGNNRETEFVDVFTLSEHGLLLSCRRFHGT